MIQKATKPLDPRNGLRLFLVLDGLLRAWIWSMSAVVTTATVYHYRLWPDVLHSHKHIVWRLMDAAWASVTWIVLFNAAYVVLLVILRLGIPTPKEGRYTLKPGRLPSLSLITSCFCAVLTKARYQAPFPGFLVFNLANLPPLVWLMGPIFGPKSRSCYVVDPNLLDPHLIEVGRNVIFGFGTMVAGHSQERDVIIIKKTIIEDDVLFGGNCVIYGGCRIGRGAVVLSGAVVPPNTVIGANELWGGLPAKKIKDLPPYDERLDEAGPTAA